jgi:hypothetical protein
MAFVIGRGTATGVVNQLAPVSRPPMTTDSFFSQFLPEAILSDSVRRHAW